MESKQVNQFVNQSHLFQAARSVENIIYKKIWQKL